MSDTARARNEWIEIIDRMTTLISLAEADIAVLQEKSVRFRSDKASAEAFLRALDNE